MTRRTSLLIVVHVLCWLLFLSLIVSFIATSAATADVTHTVFSTQFILFAAIYVVLFYLNAYYLIPSLYFNKKYLLYLLTSLVIFISVYLVKPFDNLFQLQSNQQERYRAPRPPSMRPPPPPFPQDEMHAPPQEPQTNRERHADIVSLILLVMIYSLSWAVQIVKKWRSVEERAVRAEADKWQAELAFLKAQINPHFLFNTLNNIYSLAVIKSDAAADAIMKLSKIMRYVTDEVSDDFVDLESEVNFIQDYIDLQRLRLTSKVQVKFSVQGSLQNKKISPLILMPFIENVFKYGVSNHEPSDISIQLFAAEHQLRFVCSNKTFATIKNHERTGIGIENTRKRLEHLYAAKHSLNISTTGDMYSVELSLQV